MGTEPYFPKPAPQAATTQETLDEYQRLKEELLTVTLASGIIGTAAAYASYGKGIGVSFGVGALASVLYVQLLARSVNAVAAESMEDAMGGGAGQLRLLIPALLAAIFSMYHDKVAVQYGLDLNVVGLLAGFYVNKVGQVVE